MSRRRFVTGAAAGGLLLGTPLGAVGRQPEPLRSSSTLAGNRFELNVGYREVNFTGSSRTATVVNGSLPAPLLRWKEGDDVRLRVHNNLAHDSSIHWHGILLPPEMDGVPGISFPGIPPGGSFDYRFKVAQSGTYWYHSHSGFQEQTGVYGAIVIDPIEPEPFSCDRDYVVLLSDWSDEKPERIFARLKKESHYYNFRARTARDLMRDLEARGMSDTWADRAMWNEMRMSDRDISDVTGYTYTFLMNGMTPATGWFGEFKRGERVRLRFINAAAMTLFDVRIPGVKMTVIAADGQYVEPVTVDEFRMGVAETYDVLVEPEVDACTIFAQAIDRTGYALGRLAVNAALRPSVPVLDPPPVLTHADMGMGHGGMDHAGHHGAHDKPKPADQVSSDLSPAGQGSTAAIVHARSEFGAHVDMRAERPLDRIDDPGIGLRGNGRRVLTYADLFNLEPTLDSREPAREIQLHLTGNMSRYMWSMDGIRFSDAEPLRLEYNERLRITLVNDTMMNHPIHLHGMWSELETGDGDRIPRKHTVIVQPGAKLSYLATPDIRGDWAYHCHLLYHMAGMFRKVVVT